MEKPNSLKIKWIIHKMKTVYHTLIFKKNKS